MYRLGAAGAYAGAAALSAGVLAELVAARMMALGPIRELKAATVPDPARNFPMTCGYIARFYYPLALVSLLDLGVQPMITFFMGKSRFPIESLVALTVVNSLLFIFKSVGFSMLEVVITLIKGQRERLMKLRNFAVGLAGTVMIVFFFVAYTPLSRVWFQDISGLTPHLTGFVQTPARILVLLPALAVLITFQWGVLVHAGKTGCLLRATAVEVITTLAVLAVLIGWMDSIGVQAAAVAFVFGSAARCLYLFPHYQKAKKIFHIS